MPTALPTLSDRLAKLDDGTASSVSMLGEVFAQSADPAAQSIYTQLFERQAQAEAAALDAQRNAGLPLGPLRGLPIAVKDLFDVAGQVASSGSKLLADQPPATIDSEVVRRARQSDAVVVGHTNMTEFAYSGLGLNPHYGTPANPQGDSRIPGGSSSGSAAAVARGAAAGALATDTGGSARIPAAFCGLVGFKPTQCRVPRTGMFPLSTTLDCIGPIAPSVDCCFRLDNVLSGQASASSGTATVHGLRLAAPTRYVLDGMDTAVAAAYEKALQTLSDAGALVKSVPFNALERLPELGKGGGFPAAESYHFHEKWLSTHHDAYDPRVSQRIDQGSQTTAAEYIELHQCRDQLMATVDQAMMGWDALVMPTVPIVPPLFDELEEDDEYTRINKLVLRNPTVANLLDLCSVTLPCHRAGDLPVGLMLMGRTGKDKQLLRVAAGVEMLLDSLA